MSMQKYLYTNTLCIILWTHVRCSGIFAVYMYMLNANVAVNNIKRVLHRLPQKAPKLACFVLYLKIIHIFLKNNICIL